MRLFVALDPPEEARREVRKICRDVPGARWTPPHQLHLTLRFIGEADPAQFSRVREALAAVCGEPFSLRLQGAGRFPPRGAPRILWVGVDPEEPVRGLAEGIERALAGAGLEPESRPFSPHLTLARLRDARFRDAGEFLVQGREFRTDFFPVAEFFLYSSVLAPGGATHTREAAYPLREIPGVSGPARE